jgi:hypothetical protein
MTAQQTPFEQVLGADFERLPEPVQHVHGQRQPLRTAGRANIIAATSFIARLISWQAGLPRPGDHVEVTVVFTPDGHGGEHWDRTFGHRRYASTITAGTGRDASHVVEHFGPYHLLFKLEPKPEGLVWTLAGWRLLGVPLPRWTVPTIKCVEGEKDGAFTFDIDVRFPLIGWLLHYRGWLRAQAG